MKRIWCLLLLLMSTGVIAEMHSSTNASNVLHYQTHHRYDFGIQLLKLALAKSGKPYTLFGIDDDNMNEARGESLVISGKLDVQFLSTTAEREALMIPIKEPVYRGLLGLRLLLIQPASNAHFKNVKRLRDLRHFVGGHGAHWGDLPVYDANRLKVMPIVDYGKIFEMLKLGRIDYFHRGVSEIWGELERYSTDFVIADGLMLFYPHPVYFFVSKHRPELAADIQTGLTAAKADGDYQALFEHHYREHLNKAQINNRALILLKNPVLPPDSPPLDTSWWLPHGFGVSQ